MIDANQCWNVPRDPDEANRDPRVSAQPVAVAAETDSISVAPVPDAMSVPRRAFSLMLAGVFFTLGLLGALLPLLPATPFLLLTSYFLARSSPRLQAALLRSRFVGPILVDWESRGGIRQHVRIKSIVIVLLAVALTIYWSGASLPIGLATIGLASIGILVILRLPAVREA
ncbi:Inner membrane protein YbaN [Planctomycetes bacterium Pan216]|uniref:Inner membrane protein YbaN n=1 Tax=Kolteria novifilia TaxID=2527975 RepID=A0A518B3K9_9BACT|nr:Inner membrane protein YbaN [Planctomycetes bacterium Pan216]